MRMSKPFIILALPRTGTKMFCDAIRSHPDIPSVHHEFRGTEEEFWESPYVLSNYWHDWMDDERITKIHLYRENAIAGAQSMLMMHYNFPDNVVTLPVHEVQELANKRKAWDAELAKHADHTLSYEQACGGKEATELPVSELLCEWLSLSPQPLITTHRKNRKIRLRNNREIECLSA